MFNNIGRKIKITAKVFCWIGIILSVAGGVGLIVAGFSGMLPQASSIMTILGGIGTALLYASEAEAKRRGAESLELMVWSFNKSAMRFYESAGMTVRSLVMEKKL